MTLLAHFLAIAFIVNGVPHFVHGVSGKSFQSPFAQPPGVGESSAIVNVLWGAANFIVGYALLVGFAPLAFGFNIDTLVALTGGLAMALGLAWHFQKVRKK